MSIFFLQSGRETLRRIAEAAEGDLLNVQIIFLYGFEAVQSQVVVRLTEHADLPGLRLFTLTNTNTQGAVMTSHHQLRLRRFSLDIIIIIIFVTISDLVIGRSLVSFFVSLCVRWHTSKQTIRVIRESYSPSQILPSLF